MNHALELLKAEAEKIRKALNNEAGGVVRAIKPDGSPMITLAGYPEDRAYWRPACSDDKELLKSLRVGDYVIGQVGTGRVFHAFHIVEAGSREMFEKRLKELEDAMAALEKPRFCAVIQREGTIRPPRFSNDLAALVRELHAELDDEFDHETDDCRVFNEEGQLVYIFTPLWELERDGDAEYITENGCDIVTMPDQGAVISGVVHLTRVYPDEADREGDPK